MQKHGVTRRSFVKGGVAASALAALAACGKKQDSAGSTGGAKTGGTFTYYINDPVAIDPYNLQESEGTQVGTKLFDTLVFYDWNKEDIVPLAAESWEVSDDATQFTFHLVKGAKFHNGDPVDAKSFKRAWERICDPTMATPSEVNYHLAPIAGYDDIVAGNTKELSGVTCPDDNTLVVKLSAPMSDFLVVCAHPALAPVPQAALDDPASFLVAPIGNGPFKMNGKWESGQYINLVRFDDYYGEKPVLDGINFSIQKDPKTAFREFEAGNIDFCQVPTGRLAEITEKYGASEDGYTVTPKHQVLTGAESSVYYLAVNLNNPTMANVNVRKAMSLAINRQNIVDTLYEGSRKPATGIFPLVIDDNQKNVWEFCKYDPDQAKKIVDENGLAGTEITLSYNSGGGHEDLMSTIQGDLEAVGFKVTQDSLEWASYLQKLQSGNYMMGRMGWIADYPTLDNFLYPNFYSTADNNYSKYVNPEVDKAIDEARQITDEDKRKDAYREANQLIAADLPVIPIMFYAHNHVGSDKIAEMFFNPQSIAELEKSSLQA